MAKYCADCCEMDTTPNKNGLFKCINCRKSGYDLVSARMLACNSFTEAFNSRRGESERNNLMRVSRDHGYFILTAIMELINFPEENGIVESFAYLKDQILPLLKGGSEWVMDYEMYGPAIAEALRKDENAFDKAFELYMSYIVPFYTLMSHNKVDEAFVVYNQMYERLKISYNIGSSPKVLAL